MKVVILCGLLILGLFVFTLLIGGVVKKSHMSQTSPHKQNILLSSAALDNSKEILPMYTCDGVNMSPTLLFSQVPKDALSIVIIMDDPDAPLGIFTHWMVWNIPPSQNSLEPMLPTGATLGTNDFGKNSYSGPCPPAGVHRYYIRIYALDTLLSNPSTSKRKEIDAAMQGHITGYGEIIGTYKHEYTNN
jgi:Raf kinase inhibitor-like YbhB/YbcL family protein